MPDIITPPSSPVLRRSDALDERKWKVLLSRIKKEWCTPFLGTETCFDFSIPSASIIADEWAGANSYPFEDRTNLPRVAQFVAYKYGEVNAVKEELAEKFQYLKAPDFNNPDEPYRILASLPLSIYINTHYYAFMTRALMSQHREPQPMICRWYDTRPVEEGADVPANYEPTPACPLVFHMFGHVTEPRSLVLTEDDYLDFLAQTSERPELIPIFVQNAMTNYSLLFFGYQVRDLDFRVLLRSLKRIWVQAGKTDSSAYTTQLVHVGEKAISSDQLEDVKKYFQYCSGFGRLSIGVYWGSTNEFITELRQRWEDHNANDANR
jgi:hypothetical protein